MLLERNSFFGPIFEWIPFLEGILIEIGSFGCSTSLSSFLSGFSASVLSTLPIKGLFLNFAGSISFSEGYEASLLFSDSCISSVRPTNLIWLVILDSIMCPSCVFISSFYESWGFQVFNGGLICSIGFFMFAWIALAVEELLQGNLVL